jgi:peptidoglycan hydrolase CwlO-like protein
MMSRKMEAVDHATMAALVGAVVLFINKASSALDQWTAKKNGGTTHDNLKKAQSQIDDIDKRLTVVESKIEDVRDSLKDMKGDVQRYHKELMQTREEFRVSFRARLLPECSCQCLRPSLVLITSGSRSSA